MVAIEIEPEAPTLEGLKVLAAAAMQEGDYMLGQVWFDVPENTSWQRGGDATDRDRRIKVVRRFVRRFGSWEHAN
jgi:hypothetical protein